MPGTGHANPLLVARAIWASLLAAVGAYVGVVLVVPGAGSPGAEPVLAALMLPMLLAVAWVLTGVVWFVHLRFLAPAPGRRPAAPAGGVDPERTFLLLVLCWGLGEAIGVFGLVLGILGRELETALVFFAWSAALLLVVRPRPAHFRQGPGPSLSSA
jgi:hypothetical protein